MPKLIYVQSVLPADVLQLLKYKAKESSTKEALSKAIYHYLNCEKENEGLPVGNPYFRGK